jgi:hypothetical protein
MAGWDHVRRMALALPEVSEDGGERPAWRVKGKQFVWDRPLRRGDLAHLGASAPEGPVLGAYVADLGAKEALLGTEAPVLFTTPHFDGYPIVLVRLDEASEALLDELVVEAWLSRAPRRLAASYLASRGDREGG